MVDHVAPALLREAARLGARDLTIEQGGKHPRLVGRIGNASFCHVFPLTASDWRSERNSISQLRRTLRRLAPATVAMTSAPKPRARKARSRAATPRPPAAPTPAVPATGAPDAWHGPLAELQARLAKASHPSQPEVPTVEPVSLTPPAPACDCPAGRIVLRTPWLGKRPRYQQG